MPILTNVKQARFHGRYENSTRRCDHPGCPEAGEFRAPGAVGSSFDGPGTYRWLCLEHIREFNASYDWFEGMSAEEIIRAQSPTSGWRTESPSFRPDAGIGGMPRWADFEDPLDAILARAHALRSRAAGATHDVPDPRFSREEVQALETMGLGGKPDRRMLRQRYSELVRRYHPDRNGGDRSHEARLQQVVQAYQLLRTSRVFA